MADYQEIDQKVKEILEAQDFATLFSLLNLKSEKVIKAVLFITAKLAYWRERRFDRILLSKDISFITMLAHFHLTRKTDFMATNQYRILRKDITCEEAQEYFIDHMVSKEVFDIFERKIIIPEGALDCFYKDEITGKHRVAPEYYRLYRARRLPWVIITLEKTQEIYVLNKPKYKCEEFFYVGFFDIPFEYLDEEDNVVERYHSNYFIVLARRKYKMKELEFVTEYPMFDYFDLLQYIEKWKPYEELTPKV